MRRMAKTTRMSRDEAGELDWSWVDAAPFRAHARHLMTEVRVPWRVLAGYTRVPDRMLHKLLHGRPDGRHLKRIAPQFAERLLVVQTAALRADLAAAADPALTARACQALVSAGWPPAEVAAEVGLSETAVRQLVTGGFAAVTRRVELAAQAMCRARLGRIIAPETLAGETFTENPGNGLQAA